MLGKSIGTVVAIIAITGVNSIYAITELERTTISEPRLENAFGTPIDDNVNVNQQIQISADIVNHQSKSQNFIYIIQVKDENEVVVHLGWISGQLTPNQKLNPSLSWTPEKEGEFIAEIFVWEGLKYHSALTKNIQIQINVS